MRKLLKIHPDSPSPANLRIAVDVTRPHTDRLALCYVVTGNVGALRMLPLTAAARADALWQHTCFEAFLRASSADYWEFNFAPSTRWAAYRFSGYRSGGRPVEIAAPVIAVQADADRYTVQVMLELGSVAESLGEGSWRLGLSAVLEATSGGMSYWALVHPPGKPDFHHSEGFACELAAPERERT